MRKKKSKKKAIQLTPEQLAGKHKKLQEKSIKDTEIRKKKLAKHREAMKKHKEAVNVAPKGHFLHKDALANWKKRIAEEDKDEFGIKRKRPT